MDSDILREFVSLVETCSFQETAERLHVSQSALTKHIHKLEKDLGVSLFDRSTRSVSLNEYSQALYPFAQQIVKLDEKSREELARLQDQQKNILRVYFTPTAAHYGIIDVLSYFMKLHPNIELKVTENTKVTEALENAQCDFAFAAENSSIDSKFRKTIYHKDHIAIIVPKNHPLAGQKSVTLNDIAKERFVLHVNSRGGLQLETRQIMELLEKNGIHPQIASTASFTSTVIKFVEHGNCIAVLPLNRIPADSYGIETLDLVPYVYSYIYMLSPANKRITGAAKIFTDFIRKNAVDEDDPADQENLPDESHVST